MKKHKHTQLGRHKESEHEALIPSRIESSGQNELFKTENAAIKRNSLREEKEAVRLNAKKHQLSRNSDSEDID